ncbi:guanine deaminase [Colletotrichum incanum]|uniref:Guanine deaminase n=1 Tax=Colletotrichum incanum TaxID=1573173 RepID=A0A161VXV5_COLIC|nr:guanine deaminase [Colletotrichum incanum]OHW97519.1 guanine deaminase [Colletotrichum incanum]
MAQASAFHGALIHSLGPNQVEILENAGLVIGEDGLISELYHDISAEELLKNLPRNVHFQKLEKGQFLSPGFIDTHNHAPQWAMRSLGQGLHILDWLEQVTFPHEAKFSDPVYAQKVYESCVKGFLKQGITTASYYGSKHAEATQILADTCKNLHQRAFVGKCNMDRNAPSYLHDESAELSLKETVECIKHIRQIDPTGQLVRPVLTPRFAICCTPALLAGLGKMASEDPELAIQTHFNEAEQEIKATRDLFPEFSSEADLYHHYGLLNRRSILAHCTLMTEYEVDKIREYECGVAHCPISNMTVGGGFMAASVRQFLNKGIKVGLGTDSGGGFSSSMLDSIRQAIIASNAREVISKGKDKALSLDEVFYLSTLGGASVCCLEDKVGNFAVGKEFDAIWVNCPLDGSFGVMTVREETDSLRTIFEKFLMTGDDRNIARVYVQGKLVKDGLTT